LASILISDLNLNVGDIIYDTFTKETGTLLRRYCLSVDCDWEEEPPDDTVWAWDIFWTGTAVIEWRSRISTYTEEGLRLIIDIGVLQLQKR